MKKELGSKERKKLNVKSRQYNQMVTIYALKIHSMKQMHQQSGFYLIYWGRVHCCHLSMTLELHIVHNQVIFCNQINLISTSKICTVFQQFPINKICSHVLETLSCI